MAGFTGQVSTDGVVEFATRTFDPVSRVWLQEDSYRGVTSRASSMNRYAYVEGAPESFVDVLGFYRAAAAIRAQELAAAQAAYDEALKALKIAQGEYLRGAVSVAGLGTLPRYIAQGLVTSPNYQSYLDNFNRAAQARRDAQARARAQEAAAARAAAQREADRDKNWWDRAKDAAVRQVVNVVTAQAGGSKCTSLAGVAYFGFSGGVSCQYQQAQYYDFDPAGTVRDIGNMLVGEVRGAGKFVAGLTPIPMAVDNIKCLAGGWSRMQECAGERRAEVSGLWDEAKDYYVRTQTFNAMVGDAVTGQVSVGEVWDYGYQIVRDYTFGSWLDACQSGDYVTCGEGTSEGILTVGTLFIPGAEGAGASEAAANAARAAEARAVATAEAAAAARAEAAAAEATRATSSGTVWDNIVATQGTYPGSELPRSFTLAAGDTEVWVSGNATEHMAEYLSGLAGRGATRAQIDMATQAQLWSLESAVTEAGAGGLVLDELVVVGGWELKFGAPREPGQLPALVHALYTG